VTRVHVVGSINQDIVAEAGRYPRPGETIIGRNLRIHPGGKGANQAVAAARAGVHPHSSDVSGTTRRDRNCSR
jgi:ribokinase